MKFGVFFICEFYPEVHRSQRDLLQEILQQTEMAERMGFDSVWVAEHHFHPQYGICPSPPVLLSAMAQRTNKIRLGSAVSLLPFRNPIETAEQYALLDVLSNGRINLGVGRGYIQHEYAGFNLPYEESRERFVESLDVIHKAWRKERFSHDGRFYHYQDVALNLLPIQNPSPPIYMAAVSPESFELASRFGHGYMVIPHTLPPAELKRNLDLGRESWLRNGRSLDSLEVAAAYHALVDENPTRAHERGNELLNTYYKLVSTFTPSSKHKYMAEIRASYKTHDVEEVQRNRSLIGSPSEVIQRLEYYAREFGITQFLFICNTGGISNELTMQTLRLVGERVIPHFIRSANSQPDVAAR
jgi:luciferase family oxidoreductase group 1